MAGDHRGGLGPWCARRRRPRTRTTAVAAATPHGVAETDRIPANGISPEARHQWLSRLVTAEEAARWAQLPGLAALQWLTGKAPGDEAARQVEAAMQRELVSVHATVSSRQQQTQIELTQTEWASQLQQLIARLLDGDQRPSPEERARRLRAVLGEPLLREATPGVDMAGDHRGGLEPWCAREKTSPRNAATTAGCCLARYQWLSRLVTAEEAERWAQLPGLAALQWLTGKAPGDEAARQVEATMQRELVSVHASASPRQQRTQIELTQTEWASHLQQLIARLLDDDQRPSPEERARRLRAVLEEPLLREATPASIWQAITAVALRLARCHEAKEDATRRCDKQSQRRKPHAGRSCPASRRCNG